MIEQIDAGDALSRYVDERETIARYPNRIRDAKRLFPYPLVKHKPKFEITKASRIFAIGSCFAMNIESELTGLGMNVLSASKTVRASTRVKYTTKSILQDLTVVSETDDMFGSMYRLDDGWRTLNFSASIAKKSQSEDDCRGFIRGYFEHLAMIESADVVVITLGLVENWFDNERGRYINVTPPRDIRDRYSFLLHVLSYGDVLDDLHNIVCAIRKRSSANILVTVSPVPLTATFRGQDCMQANMYSKCVQRAAIEHVCANYPFVAYFPSYEMVVMADSEFAWGEKDYRHVKPEMVSHIMRCVLSDYGIGESHDRVVA